ncbi:hypothetical protein RDABS01_035477 [Bienertia sinuspersici]
MAMKHAMVLMAVFAAAMVAQQSESAPSPALSLPDACHVHASSADKCGLTDSPTGAPSQSPAAGGGAAVSPAGTPSASSIAKAPSTGIGGSEVSPAMSPGSSSSSSAVGFPLQLIAVCLAVALFSRL